MVTSLDDLQKRIEAIRSTHSGIGVEEAEMDDAIREWAKACGYELEYCSDVSAYLIKW
jgi:hypothetical protein